MRRLLSLLVLGVWSLAGCVDDPNDPKSWIKKLDDVREQKDAVHQLQRLANPVAIGPLSDYFKRTKDADALKAIVSFKDKSSVPLLIESLEYTEDSFDNAATAAHALGELGDASAVEPLTKVLQKKLPIKTRANVVKQEAIHSLAKLKDKRAVAALIATLETPADEQDFFLNKEAAVALGELGDPAAVPALVRGLFMTGRGADIFQHCRTSLAQIGKPALQPLVEAMQRKNAKLEEDAKKYEFVPGVIVYKTARVIGDLRDKSAVPALLAELKKPGQGNSHNGLLSALGFIGDASVSKDVVAILNDGKRDGNERIAAAESLNLIGDASALPALMGVIKGKGDAQVRAGAALAYSRLGGAAEAAAFAPLAANEKDEPAIFEQANVRLELAKKCDKDAGCYTAALDEKDEVKQEKAAFALARMGKPALASLTKKIGSSQPVVWQAAFYGLGRNADKSDAAVVKALDNLIELDRTKPPMRDRLNEARVLRAVIAAK